MARCPDCGSRLSGGTCPRCGAGPTQVFLVDVEEQDAPTPALGPRQPPGIPVRVLAAAGVVLLAAVAAVFLLPSTDEGAVDRVEVSEDPTGRVFALVGEDVEIVDDGPQRRSTVVEGDYVHAVIAGDRLVLLPDGPEDLSSISVSDPSQRISLGSGSWLRPSTAEGRVWVGEYGGARQVRAADGALHRRVGLEPGYLFLADLGGPVLVAQRERPGGGGSVEMNLRIKSGAGPEFPPTARFVAARSGMVATMRCGEGCALHLTPVGSEGGPERTLTGEGIRSWYSASFSPDGELLAAMRRIDGAEAVAITNPAEEWSRAYVLGAGFTTEPAWSADSRWLFVGFGPDGGAADRIVAFNRDAGFSSRTLSIRPREPFTSLAVR